MERKTPRFSNGTPRTCVGIDGCRLGWVAAILRKDHGLEFRVSETLELLFKDIVAPGSVWIDMPIGLPGSESKGVRKVDKMARSLLMGGRKASVFSPPIRDVIGCESFEEACSLSRKKIGKAFSIQSWNILPKIIELDQFIERNESGGIMIFESHPELVFRCFTESPLSSKRSKKGKEERSSILAHLLDRFSIHLDDVLEKWRTGVGEDDFLDAAILCLGQTVSESPLVFPLDEFDSTGKSMRMVIPRKPFQRRD